VKADEHLLLRDTDLPLSSNLACLGSVVCFCDIPLHMSKYSMFGLAFAKDFQTEVGAVPVIYVPENGRPALLPYEGYGRKSISSQKVVCRRRSRAGNRNRKRPDLHAATAWDAACDDPRWPHSR
jgi:hypothetical protein